MHKRKEKEDFLHFYFFFLHERTFTFSYSIIVFLHFNGIWNFFCMYFLFFRFGCFVSIEKEKRLVNIFFQLILMWLLLLLMKMMVLLVWSMCQWSCRYSQLGLPPVLFFWVSSECDWLTYPFCEKWGFSTNRNMSWKLISKCIYSFLNHFTN